MSYVGGRNGGGQRSARLTWFWDTATVPFSRKHRPPQPPSELARTYPPADASKTKRQANGEASLDARLYAAAAADASALVIRMPSRLRCNGPARVDNQAMPPYCSQHSTQMPLQLGASKRVWPQIGLRVCALCLFLSVGVAVCCLQMRLYKLPGDTASIRTFFPKN